MHLGRGPRAQAADNGGQEGRVAIKHGVDSELAKREHPHLPVFESFDHVVLVQRITRARVSDLTTLSHYHQLSLFFRQIVCRLGAVGQPEINNKPENNAGQSFDDKDPVLNLLA